MISPSPVGFESSFWALLPMWYGAFILSLTCHEAAHALAAKLGGDRTAEEAGQVSLHPWPHMRREPVGTIIVPLAVYFLQGGGWMIGWASAPFDPAWAARHPRRAAWMAASGPAANFVLVLLVGLGLKIGLMTGLLLPSGGGLSSLVVTASGQANAFTVFASILFTLNLILGIFNLLPVPPLDGHAVVPLFLDDERGRAWTRLTRDPWMSLLGLLIAWKAFPYIFVPVWRFTSGVLLS